MQCHFELRRIDVLSCALPTLRVYRRRDDASARQLFGYSILYLFALFAALIVDRAAAFQPLGSFWGGG